MTYEQARHQGRSQHGDREAQAPYPKNSIGAKREGRRRRGSTAPPLDEEHQEEESEIVEIDPIPFPIDPALEQLEREEEREPCLWLPWMR